MHTILEKSTAATVVVLLVDSAGLPVEGLTYTDVFVDLKKASGSFEGKVLGNTDLVELTDGLYELSLSVANTNTVGDLIIRASSPDTAYCVSIATVVSSLPSFSTNPVNVEVGYIFGFLSTISGDPMEDSSIIARVLVSPSSSSGSGAAFSNYPSIVKSDSEGFFLLKLVAGTVVDIVISDLNFRRAVTVPASSVNLFLLE